MGGPRGACGAPPDVFLEGGTPLCQHALCALSLSLSLSTLYSLSLSLTPTVTVQVKPVATRHSTTNSSGHAEADVRSWPRRSLRVRHKDAKQPLMSSPAEPWWTPQPVDPRSWYSTLHPSAKHEYPSRFESGPNSSWHRCYSPVDVPNSGCESPEGECVRISKLEQVQLRRGGCFLIHGVHRLDAPLELPCPIRLVGQNGELGPAVLSGGVHLHNWAKHSQGGESFLISAPLEPRSVRQLFLGSRHAERGQLTRLSRGEQNLFGPPKLTGQKRSTS